MTLQGGRGLLKVPSYAGMRLWPNRHITFIVAKKVKFRVPLALFTV